jgi:molybdopterin-containing oxidoreductase family iron-sulfur binding subunit
MSSMKERNGYWRSLGELADTPAYRAGLAREFAKGAVDMPGPFTRRKFLQLMSASVALAGFSGCRWPKEKIVPYAHRPEGRIPGVPLRFATSSELWGHARGLVVTSYDGRPIKVDGNALDPISGGASTAIDQAGVLELYDPDRSRSVVRREGGAERNVEWSDFLAWADEHFASHRANRGAGLYVLCEATSSETVAMLRRRFATELPHAEWYEYEPLSTDVVTEGAKRVFGEALRPHYDLSSARVLLSLDSDFLDDDPAALLHTRDFASSRRLADGRMNRLYAVESVPSVTGSMADHRLPLAPNRMGPFTRTLLALLVTEHDLPVPEELRRSLEVDARFMEDASMGKFTRAVAGELAANRGRSLVLAGYRQPLAVHARAHLLNAVLGNVGSTVRFTAEPAYRPRSEEISALARSIRAKRTETLLLLGGNPVYDAPRDLGFAEILGEVPAVVHLSFHRNETSRLATWHLPRAHFLESWDAGRGYDGTLLARQPLIEPLYGGRTPAELLSVLLDGAAAKSAYGLAREAFAPFAPPDSSFESVWRRFLHDGILAGSAAEQAAPTLKSDSLAWVFSGEDAAPDAGGLEAVLLRDPRVHDGRFANNGWLQELPGPLTKLTWDNAALLSPSTAKRLGIETEDLVRIRLGDREIDIAALLLPGVAPNTIGLPLGYGRTAAGRVGNGVGFDTYRLLRSAEIPVSPEVSPFLASGVSIEKLGKRHVFACTQDHHLIDPRAALERERRAGELIREVDAEEFRADPKEAMGREEGHEPPLVSLWKDQEHEGHKWGMAIDLTACTGCNACVVACQAENNIPVVGKEQVRRQREMQWIRVDTYFRGDPEAPESVHQPVACVHCEHAPCEQVCPVGATVHSTEGLNVMVYNRCIGTRYCSNNCPYKVRRFNFFNYQKHLAPIEKMVKNPEVTVRSRGVMEKCTYCVQRIESVKIRAKNEKRPIRDGEIAPACAEACPARAIVFGDRSDPESRVSKLLESPRAYAMLGHLNVRPRTEYLARLRNPNPLLRGKDDHEPRHG